MHPRLRLLGAALSSLLFYALCAGVGHSALPQELVTGSPLLTLVLVPCAGACVLGVAALLALLFCYAPAAQFWSLTAPTVQTGRKRK